MERVAVSNPMSGIRLAIDTTMAIASRTAVSFKLLRMDLPPVAMTVSTLRSLVWEIVMKRVGFVSRSMLALCAISVAPCSEAVALHGNKATDDSVCDLAPHTIERLSRKALVPWTASAADQAEAYFRLGANFIVKNCVDKQILILHGSTDNQVDSLVLENIANRACVAAEVRRASLPVERAGRSSQGIELRCPIAKHSLLGADLTARESKESLRALLLRMQQSNHATSDDKKSVGVEALGARDCSKVSLGTVVLGGASSGCK